MRMATKSNPRVTHRRRAVLLAMLGCVLGTAVYRVAFYVPQPGIDLSKLTAITQPDGDNATLHAIPLWTDEVSRP